MITFQDIIFQLYKFWTGKGCIVVQPIDLNVGAATFHSSTFLRAVRGNSWNAVYVQSSRRPTDGRYAKNPTRGQHYYQFQVVLKPSSNKLQKLYFDSLHILGINTLEHDVLFVEDNWESPTLGAWGLGWEIWMNGMEISQLTYFQQMGGVECFPVTVEITYGLERLAMYLQDIDSIYNILWTKIDSNLVYYGDLFYKYEIEMSLYNFEESDVSQLYFEFLFLEKEILRILGRKLIYPAYEMLMRVVHIFNLLDARRVISSIERQNYIFKIRTISCKIARFYCGKK